MKTYHKIQTVWLRDPDNNYKTLLEGEWAKPEFEYLADNEWVFTEKVDGTNIRVMWDGENVMFGGKTDNAQIPQFLVNKLNERFFGTANRQKFLEVFGEDGQVCLYGEGYGNKIQKVGGEYITDGQDFVLFDVKISDILTKLKEIYKINDK